MLRCPGDGHRRFALMEETKSDSKGSERKAHRLPATSGVSALSQLQRDGKDGREMLKAETVSVGKSGEGCRVLPVPNLG